MSNLSISLEHLNSFSSKQATILRKEFNISTLQDLLHFFPFRYIDRTHYFRIRELKTNNSEVQIVGVITHIRIIQNRRNKRLEARFKDDTGGVKLVWFRVPSWLQESLKINEPYVVFGKCTRFQNTLQITHPEIELLSKHKTKKTGHVEAIYPSTKKISDSGVSYKRISKAVYEIFRRTQAQFSETFSQKLRSELNLISKNEALYNVHFPSNQAILSRALFRLKFEELFFVQLQLLHKNFTRKEQIKGFVFDKVGSYFNAFYGNFLPFSLTNAQKKVIKEIRKDLGNGIQMNRLLQGDVGSGKTIVAFMTALIALDNDFQACVLAPTEILSSQHYKAFLEFAEKLNIRVALLTGSTKTKVRRELLEDLASGDIKILVGTHALLEDRVVFNKLGLAIVDEQHRFGVAQRAKLWRKNDRIPPHILVMTATPIPRTLAMSLYGDLDMSVIDELPPGRKAIQTIHKYDPSHRLQVFKFMRDEIKKGRQIYVVYPLIEESETMDYKDLMDGYNSLEREFPMPKYQISVVHGQMKSEDKEFEMMRFVRGETDIMVATTVIEVGVNVPNASVMIIQSAEKFGLSQLHQLRGRVGRGAEQSYCMLVTGHKLTSDAKTRIETMVSTTDGFKIAEVDLKLRGPGDLMGTQQSGIMQLKIADIVKDNQILKLARYHAYQILKEDYTLSNPQNIPIKKAFEQLKSQKTIWNLIS